MGVTNNVDEVDEDKEVDDIGVDNQRHPEILTVSPAWGGLLLPTAGSFTSLKLVCLVIRHDPP